MIRTGFLATPLALGCLIIGSSISTAGRLCAQDSLGTVTRLDAHTLSESAPPHSKRPSLDTINSDTRWAFRSFESVSISSPIVRLGDVIQPLNPGMAGWQRLKRSPIALLPVNSRPMRIDRDRLERVILDAEATPLAIDWIGPEQISVTFQESVETLPDSSSLRPASHQVAAKDVNAKPDTPTRYERDRADSGFDKASDHADQEVSNRPLSRSDVERISKWLMLALDRSQSDITKKYEVLLPSDPTLLSSLASVTRITSVSPIGPVSDGVCRFQITGYGTNGPQDAELAITLKSHPMVVCVRKTLTKGHRVTLRDLKLEPLAESEIEEDHIFEPTEVIGMEVQGFPRVGLPLRRSDLGEPTLIRRGDLIELRVMGGGITVTTNAKSHGDGAESDLIEIETFEPRKRLLARVVQPGLVEIVTRAPKVNP